MATLLLKVRALFDSAQQGSIVLSKLCEQLSELQSEATVPDFWDAFLHHVEKSIIYYKPEPAVERMMEFIALFATYSTRIKYKKKEDEERSADPTPLHTPSDESEEDESDILDPFLLECFNYFVTNHNAREKGVRLRCCQLINKLLNLLGESATIDEDLSDDIYECMMIRIKDKWAPIRIQAVLALYRLQDPSDEECPVIDAYLNSLEKDVHPTVRKTILNKLAISRKTLPFLIGRVRDVKEINRKASYLLLAEKVSIRALTIAQRIKLLTDGLKNNRCEEVKKACMHMVKSWFRSCGHNMIKLLESLDTESVPECSKITMEALFQDVTLEKLHEYIKQLECQTSMQCGSMKMMSHDSLTAENVFYWHSLCKHLKTRGDEGELLIQQVLPELTNFCEYIRCYAEKNFIDSAILTAFDGAGQPEFILEYLLNMAGFLDLTDEIGRRNLQTLVHDLLVLETVPISVAPILVKLFKDVESNEDAFIQFMVETISDIKQPLVQVVSTAMKERARMNELQLARINVNLNECQEDLECAIKQQDYQQAALLKDHIAELEEQKADTNMVIDECAEQISQRVERVDPETTLKCLTVATAMLGQIDKRGLSSMLMALKDDLFFEGVKNEDPFIRNEAVKGLGLLSLLKKEFASQHLILFLQVVQVDQSIVQITAAKVIFDMFMMYGLISLTEKDKEEDKEDDKTIENTLLEDKTVIGDNDETIVAETPPDKQGEGEEEDKDEEDGEKEDEQKENTAAAEGVLGVLLMFLQGENSDLRAIIAEGLAKLMITGRVVSANVLTRLIILWYNPIIEDDVQLRHCLGVFFPAFAFGSRKNQELYEQAFIPAIRTITNAPETSPLSHINISNVINLFLQLTDVRNLARFRERMAGGNQSYEDTYDSYVHDSIAMKLSNEILSDPEDPDIKLFCKALTQLTICQKNNVVVKDLLELSDQMTKALEENRTAKKMIEKFSKQLQGMSINEGTDSQTGITDQTSGISGNQTTGITNDQTTGISDTPKEVTNTTCNKENITLSGISNIEKSKDAGDDDIFAVGNSMETPAIVPASAIRNPLTSGLRSTRSRSNRSVSFAKSPPPKMQKLSVSSVDFNINTSSKP